MILTGRFKTIRKLWEKISFHKHFYAKAFKSTHTRLQNTKQQSFLAVRIPLLSVLI